MRRERWAISALFLVNGMGIGGWAAFIPIIKDRLALDDAALALILFCAAVGAIAAMPLAGVCCDRYGSPRVVALSAALFGSAAGCATAAPAFAASALAALVMGAGNGAMDVAMNVNGVTLQTRAGRPIMSSLHGLFSVGTFIAAGAMATLVAARWPQLVASAAIVVALVGAAAICRPRLVREVPPARSTAPELPRRRDPFPRRLLLLGVAAIFGAVAEGTLVEWSGVYVRESLHAGIAAALGAFAAYAVAMSTARFCGDWVVRRIGPVRLVRVSGLLGAGGLGAALVVHTYPAVLAGFFITGLGLANVSPLVYGAGAAAGGSGAGAGVAVVTTLGYSGFLIGPAIIGFTAQRASIDVAFALVALFALGIALLAPVLRADRAARSG